MVFTFYIIFRDLQKVELFESFQICNILTSTYRIQEPKISELNIDRNFKRLTPGFP